LTRGLESIKEELTQSDSVKNPSQLKIKIGQNLLIFFKNIFVQNKVFLIIFKIFFRSSELTFLTCDLKLALVNYQSTLMTRVLPLIDPQVGF
jgi:hypothetical protein